MPRIHTFIAALGVTLPLAAAVCGCGSKKDDGASRGSGEARPTAAAAPVTCPPGSAIKDGACVVVITPAKIKAVVVQQSRLDELARLLDQADTAGAPIEVFNGIRQLDEWRALAAKSERLAALEAVVDTLDQAVKTLRTFKGSVTEASGRVGHLKDELDRLMTEPASARKLEDVRTQVSSQLRGAIEPLATDAENAIQHAIVPLSTKLPSLSNVVATGCTMSKLSGGGDRMKDLCTQARATSVKALAYVDDLKTRPAKLFSEVSSQLEVELEPLIDAETRKLLDAAQRKVNEALRLLPAQTGSDPAATGVASPATGPAGETNPGRSDN